MALLEEACYGVVLYPFEVEDDDIEPHKPRTVHVGATVDILQKLTDWYVVTLISQIGGQCAQEQDFLIPSSYVKLIPMKKIKLGDKIAHLPELPGHLEEITLVLLQWHEILQKDFTNPIRQCKAKELLGCIAELHNLRKKNFLPATTVEDVKNLKKSVVRIIDKGNRIANLDIVARDEFNDVLDPWSTSTVRMLRAYRSAVKRRNVAEGKQISSERTSLRTSHSVMLTIEKVSLGFVEECEWDIRFFLCEVKGHDDPVPFTETFQITVHPRDTIPPLRTLFTDLSKSDFNRSSVYLVAYIYRIGTMLWKETGKETNSVREPTTGSRPVRRPWAVSAKDITELFKSHHDTNSSNTEDNISVMTYVNVHKEESLEGTFTKLIQGKLSAPGPGFVLRLSLFSTERMNESDLKLLGNPTKTPKMGFPDVIYPEDFRNHLYVTLCNGEFQQRKMRNIEVTVSLSPEDHDIPKLGVIQVGSGCQPVHHYRSAVYYHCNKPKWNEVLKIILPDHIDDFSKSHIKFTFQHRSSSNSKDKLETPFALAFLPLRDKGGTALKDGIHDLIVYTIDPATYNENDVHYWTLPSTRTPKWFRESKLPVQGLSHSSYLCQIKTTLCSNKLTQDAKVLNLLKWHPLPNVNHIVSTRSMLKQVRSVDGGKLLRFFEKVLDTLFRILIETGENEEFELPVFKTLVYILSLTSIYKYESFSPVVDVYIQKEFFAALAYKTLIKEIQRIIENGSPNDVLEIMKNIDYLFRFIVRSLHIRMSCNQANLDSDDDEIRTEFQGLVKNLILSMKELFGKNNNVIAQGGCLKHISSIIKSLVNVFPKLQLSELFVELLSAVPLNFTKQKLTLIAEIVHSDLFLDLDCRYIFLQMISRCLHSHLPGADDDLKLRLHQLSSETTSPNRNSKAHKILGNGVGEMMRTTTSSTESADHLHTEESVYCVQLLGDIMDILFQEENASDYITCMLKLVTPLILSIGTVGENDPLSMDLIVVLLSIFRQMTEAHHVTLVDIFKRSSDTGNICVFVNEVLKTLKNLVAKSYFPHDWGDMKFLQSRIILSTLEHISQTIRNEFSEPFQESPWSNYFTCTLAFMTQELLQLEKMHFCKRIHLMHTCDEDMRIRAADLVSIMWVEFDAAVRMRFIPYLETFVSMAFVPVESIREKMIPIFFDMLRCNEQLSPHTFSLMEDELVTKIVQGFEQGKGDREYRNTFHRVMNCMFQAYDDPWSQASGLSFVETLTKLLDYHLEYGQAQSEKFTGNQMNVILKLLEFTKEIRRDVLFLCYLYKLYDLHVESGNFGEAAFVLKLHFDLLNWTSDRIPEHLQCRLHPNMTIHFMLKGALYRDMIALFQKADMWECAIDLLEQQKLAERGNEHSMTVARLNLAISRLLYAQDFNEQRVLPDNFQVTFYGMGFPSYLQNKSFIYRGNPYDRLPNFTERMLQRYPDAELLRMDNIRDTPPEEVTTSLNQYLVIFVVTPVKSRDLQGMDNQQQDECICQIRPKGIDRFTYSRAFHVGKSKDKNNFATMWQDRFTVTTANELPGIMPWVPVSHTTHEKVRPIENALEAMEKMNEELKELAFRQVSHKIKGLVPHFDMKIAGVLRPDVNGGIQNYRTAFLTEEYKNENPDDSPLTHQLIGLVALQVEILGICLKLYEENKGKDLSGIAVMQEEMMVTSYAELKKSVESAYEINTQDFKDEDFENEIALFAEVNWLTMDYDE